MKTFLVLCFVTCALAAHHHRTTQAPTTTPDPLTDHGHIYKLQNEVDTMNKKLEALTRQLMLQQLYVDEKTRSDGDSGVKQLRHNHDGTRAFMSDTHSMSSINSIHDHSNYKMTVGMGEVIAVLNGLEFRTRHNDYKLRMPSKSSHAYNAIEDLPFPPVPPSVLSQPNVSAQMEEMRNYFKAWKYQNYHYRDYRKYFKPVLCYMEGGWTTNTKTLDEPFQSDRHFVDAKSWFDLQEKIRLTSYTGGKSNLENFSYLPSVIMNVRNGTAEFAQWNYRIMCHPIQR
ncbi:hypothetical protein FSP39_007171 [Pinctada imbricata]|uniref:Uncharacterized protein n=1 Tax=Pinctada imbricata TaxID=66713 RepID=A0AA88XQH7_PINIB|nr:hypothetical protein FSP39_007171 [Pinctada imbricata]